MPASFFPRGLPGPCHLILLVFLAVTACDSNAQISYKNMPHHSVQLQLPWYGPGSALLNPAGIGFTNHAFLQVGHFSSVSGKDIHRVYQAAVATGELLPFILAAGLGGYSNGSKIDGSNALRLNRYYAPSIAIATPDGGPLSRSLSIGMAFPIHAFNAFGVVESFAYGADLGIHWSGQNQEFFGRPQLGLAVANLVRPEADLPADMEGYLLPRAYSALLTWTSPGNLAELHAEYQFTVWDSKEHQGRSDRSELRSWGMEVRPWEYLGFVVQRTRNGPVSFGSSVRLVRPAFRAAVHVTHDRFRRVRPSWLQDDGQDEGRGYLVSFFAGMEY
jgi:hypothetical protein